MPAATMGWLVPGALGALGLLGQSRSNNSEQALANEELALQEQLIQQEEQGRQLYQNQLNQETQRGAFNPDLGIKQADADRGYQEGQALNNEAAGAKILGYRPGDTTPLQEMDATRGNYNLAAAQQDNAIRNQANANLMAATAPLIGNNSAGIAALGENYRTNLALQQPLGGMLGALAPYLTNLLGGNNGLSQRLTTAGMAADPATGFWYDPSNGPLSGSGAYARSRQAQQLAQMPPPASQTPTAAPSFSSAPQPPKRPASAGYRMPSAVFNI